MYIQKLLVARVKGQKEDIQRESYRDRRMCFSFSCGHPPLFLYMQLEILHTSMLCTYKTTLSRYHHTYLLSTVYTFFFASYTGEKIYGICVYRFISVIPNHLYVSFASFAQCGTRVRTGSSDYIYIYNVGVITDRLGYAFSM